MVWQFARLRLKDDSREMTYFLELNKGLTKEEIHRACKALSSVLSSVEELDLTSGDTITFTIKKDSVHITVTKTKTEKKKYVRNIQ